MAVHANFTILITQVLQLLICNLLYLDLRETVELAGGTETAVLCTLVGACRMVTRLMTPQQVVLRVANIASQSQKLYKDQKLAWANPNFEVGFQSHPRSDAKSRGVHLRGRVTGTS